MKKLILINILLALCSVMGMAQSVDILKADPEYVWGEGTGSNVRTADREALEQILQQNSMYIQHESKVQISNEQTSSESASTKVEFKSVMNTYSTATLNNTHRMVVENGPDVYRVFRYVKKSEIDRIFNSRKEKVGEFVQIAHRALEQKQINDALRYYYWANVLTGSLRYPEELKIKDENGQEQKATVWLPARINDIFGAMSMSILSKNENEYEVGLFY